MKTIHVRETRLLERFTPDDKFIAWWDGQAAGRMNQTEASAVKWLVDTVEPPRDKSSVVSIVAKNQRLRQALSDLLDCIDDCKGHGTPIIKDRAACYSAMNIAKEVLK